MCGSDGVARSDRSRPRKLWSGLAFGLFFKLRPAALLPPAYRFLISLQSTTRRSLAAPSQIPENAPYVSGMVLDATLTFDQLSHPASRPKASIVSKRFGSSLEPFLDPPKILRRQVWLATRAAGLFQTCHSGFGQLPRPAVNGLSVHTDPPGYLGFMDPLFQQLRRPQAACFQSFKIASYSGWISHGQEYTAQMGKCHYIIRYSIISESSGGIITTVQNTLSNLESIGNGWEIGSSEIADACECPLPEQSAEVFFSDPPYYDAVPYSDLSDFFFVWLRRALPKLPFLCDPYDPKNSLTPKTREIVVDETKHMNLFKRIAFSSRKEWLQLLERRTGY